MDDYDVGCENNERTMRKEDNWRNSIAIDSGLNVAAAAAPLTYFTHNSNG
jgi:hypothetical protein